MIKLGASILLRALVELGIVLIAFGALLLVVAYKTLRSFVTPEPDQLDKIAGPIVAALGLAAARRAARPAAAELDELDDEPELDGIDDEEAESSRDFWRNVTV